MKLLTIEFKCGWPDCDVKLAEGDPDMRTRELTIDGKTAEVDVCTKHSEALDDVLLPLMADGRIVTKTTTRKKTAKSAVAPSPQPDAPDPESTIDCLEPGCKRRGAHGLRNNAGLAQHVIKAHGYTDLDAYRVMHGLT